MNSKKYLEAGFSLFELLVVLVIFAVAVTLALVNFSKPSAQLQRQNAARQLQAFLERARADSIKRRPASSSEMAQVTINSTNSFTLLSDLNSDGVLNSSETSQVSLPATSKITGSNLVFPVTIKFNYRGQATAVDGNNSAVNPVFTICDAGCTQTTASEKNSSVIAVSPTGSIVYLKGGASLPNAALQNSTYVNANTKINRDGIVNN